MPSFTTVAASQLTAAQLEACFLHAFSDYLLGPMRMPQGGWDALVRIHGMDLALSRVAVDESGQPQAFAFTTPRSDKASWRLAAMGAIPAARGLGLAPALLDDFLARAAQAGCRRAELECFAQNERAQRLYLGRGFAAVHELPGYSGSAQGEVTSNVTDVATDDALAWLADVERHIDLPYQATSASLRSQHGPLRALRCGSAQLIVRETPDVAAVLSLVDTSRAQHDAQQLLAAVARPLRVPQVQLREVGGVACERAGLQRAELHQVWMMRTLGAP